MNSTRSYTLSITTRSSSTLRSQGAPPVMRTSSLLVTSLAGALLALVAYSWGEFAYRTLTVLGVLRSAQVAGFHVDDSDIVTITDTTHCEDLHYHSPSSTLFTACEDNAETRFKWFPPLANFDDPELGAKSRGSIHIINPKTMKSRRLEFENFDHTFVTHGIDVISDPKWPEGEAVYIFAINHVPNLEYHATENQWSTAHPKSRSQIEVLHHVIGTSTVRHIRSIWHPLLRTPNDILAISPTSIYVTNDHRYADHGIMRLLEDAYFEAKWTDVIHLRLKPLDEYKGTDAKADVDAVIAVPHMHNSNGLGRGWTAASGDVQVLVSSCSAGVLHMGFVTPSPERETRKIELLENQIQVDSVIDNPSYFTDPYGTRPGHKDDRSGYVLPGLSRAVTLAQTSRDPSLLAKDPIMVWYTRINMESNKPRYHKRLLFADDGSTIRSASAAVLVAIDPKDTMGTEDQGKRKAWLFVTGFLSRNMIAVKVDLD